MIDDVPLFPLSLVVLPGELVPLHIFEPRYRDLTARCLEGDEPFAIVLEDGEGRRSVACTARIVEVTHRFPDGRCNILVRGDAPVRLVELRDEGTYATARAEELIDAAEPAAAADQHRALDEFAKLATEAGASPDPPGDDDVPLSYGIASRVELPASAKQALLEDRDESRRLQTVTLLLRDVRRGLRLAAEVQRRASRNGHIRSAEDIASDLGID